MTALQGRPCPSKLAMEITKACIFDTKISCDSRLNIVFFFLKQRRTSFRRLEKKAPKMSVMSAATWSVYCSRCWWWWSTLDRMGTKGLWKDCTMLWDRHSLATGRSSWLYRYSTPFLSFGLSSSPNSQGHSNNSEQFWVFHRFISADGAVISYMRQRVCSWKPYAKESLAKTDIFAHILYRWGTVHVSRTSSTFSHIRRK